MMGVEEFGCECEVPIMKGRDAAARLVLNAAVTFRRVEFWIGSKSLCRVKFFCYSHVKGGIGF